MRNLTIKRTKSFVGCLAKIKIYIEDPTACEITINDTPCRKIGELKNGEEKTFSIGEQAVKVFVIADKLSKKYCNEYYQLPDGQEDILLTGKNRFNPASGNAFRFDNNTGEEILANRKRTTRKGLHILVPAMTVGVIVGFAVGFHLLSDPAPKTQTFSSNGMTVTLTNEFKEVDFGNYTVTFDSKNVAVFVLKEPFALAAGMENWSREQYADLIIQNNNIGFAEIQHDEGLTYFSYEHVNPETNKTFRFFSYVYKTNDAFWLVQFAIPDEKAEKFAQQVPEWAKSVEFSD